MPLVSSVTLSMIGCVKLNRVVGNSLRSRLPIPATSACLFAASHSSIGLSPTIISTRLGTKGSVPLSLRPACETTNVTSGNSLISDRISLA